MATITTLAACERLLATPELFEMILLELPMQTLLVKIQRICKEWSAFLESSTKLQQAMFFKPITEKPLELILSEENAEFGQLDEKPQCIFMHPLLQDWALDHSYERKEFLHSRWSDAQELKSRREHFAYREGRKDIDINYRPNMLYRREASWRKQLATQPPVDSIVHYDTEPDDTGIDVYACGLGVTLGDMVEQSDTLKTGDIAGGRSMTVVDWDTGSTYHHISQASTATYTGPWWVEGDPEARATSSDR